MRGSRGRGFALVNFPKICLAPNKLKYPPGKNSGSEHAVFHIKVQTLILQPKWLPN